MKQIVIVDKLLWGKRNKTLGTGTGNVRGGTGNTDYFPITVQRDTRQMNVHDN